MLSINWSTTSIMSLQYTVQRNNVLMEPPVACVEHKHTGNHPVVLRINLNLPEVISQD